jgi:serine protease
MNPRGLFAACIATTLIISGFTTAASANVKEHDEKISDVSVQYAAGVNQAALNGQPKPSSQQVSLGSAVFSRPILTQARAASGPRSLVARPAVSSTTPEKARVRLTWKAPEKRYGASIVGYRIQYSSNNGATYQTLISDTGSDSTRLIVSDGIRAGINYRFRVRAITNDGSLSNTVGAVSNIASTSVRTAPKPVFLTSTQRVGPGNITYLAQSLSDRGGFAANQVRYRAIATAADIESVESSLCSATRCRFPELLPDTIYTVEVVATNELGTSTSSAGVAVNDLYFPLQWYLSGRNGISMPAAWKYSKGDSDKVVAVIDTGIKSHQQIDKSLTRNADGSIYGYDFVTDLASAGDGDGEDANPNDEGGDASGGSSFHGTHVAGIIAAEHDFIGTAGVAPNIKVLPIRALGKDGGTASDLGRAIRWASGEKIASIPKNKYPVSVINLSLGAKSEFSCDTYADESKTITFSDIFRSVEAKGIAVVVAAGNESRASLSFPGNCPGVITVVATQSLGDRATYSNYGDGVLISAPGGEFNVGSTESPDSRGGIISSWIDASNLPDYRLSEGTSMAAPVVSGIVALMYSMQPGITPARVRSILQDSVRPFAAGSNCSTMGGCGAGIINAQLALARTSALK